MRCAGCGSARHTQACPAGRPHRAALPLNLSPACALLCFQHAQVGVEIIQRAIRRPAKTIANNAGLEGDVIVGKLLERVRAPAAAVLVAWRGLLGLHVGRGAASTRASTHHRFSLQRASLSPLPFAFLPPPPPAQEGGADVGFGATRKLSPLPLARGLSTAKQEGDENVGFNAAAGRFEDMVKAGVIDPMKAGALPRPCWPRR